MRMRVLVTGATGYVGGMLVPRLLERGHQVRVLVRNPERLAAAAWRDRVEMVVGDARDTDTVRTAMDRVEAAYYLIHSMTGQERFADTDRQMARTFAAAAGRDAHVIYLGGLLPPDPDVSRHLASRAEVGDILRASCRVTEFRAGPVIGVGSASFDMVRYLTQRLPVMITPRWVSNPVQPIGVENVIHYLLDVLNHEPLGVVDIGADVLTFKDMMLQYAEVMGLRRWILPVPVLAPTLAALWVGLVTPIPNSLAVPLIQGIVHPVVADTVRAETLFPDIRPLPYREAVMQAVDAFRKGK